MVVNLTQMERYLRKTAEVGYLNRSECDDFIQDVLLELMVVWGVVVFVDVLRSVESSSVTRQLPKETPRGLVFHRIVGRIKKRYQRQRQYLDIDHEEVSQPFRWWEDSSVGLDLEDSLAHLEPRESKVVALAIRGKTVKDIARDSCVSYRTVWNARHRAVEKLQSVLAG